MDISSYLEQQKKLLKQEKLRLSSLATPPRCLEIQSADLDKPVAVTPENRPAADFFEDDSQRSANAAKGSEDSAELSVQRPPGDDPDPEHEKGSTPEFSPAEKLTLSNVKRQNDLQARTGVNKSVSTLIPSWWPISRELRSKWKSC
jgi:hypothetical protein